MYTAREESTILSLLTPIALNAIKTKIHLSYFFNIRTFVISFFYFKLFLDDTNYFSLWRGFTQFEFRYFIFLAKKSSRSFYKSFDFENFKLLSRNLLRYRFEIYPDFTITFFFVLEKLMGGSQNSFIFEFIYSFFRNYLNIQII